MRGSRVKSLRRWFLERYSRPPLKARWLLEGTEYRVELSEWRLLKNHYKAARQEAKGQTLKPSQAPARIEKSPNS